MKTKQTLLITVFLLLSYFGNTQTTINNESLLKSELDTISAQKLPITSVALNQNGNWIIFYGDIGFSFVTMPAKLSAKLDTLNKKQVPLKDIDFVGNSGWVLLAEDNAFYSDSLPAKILSDLKKINQQGKIIKCISIYNDKSVVLYTPKTHYQHNISSLLKKKLSDLKYRNQRVKNIALTKKDGWIVLYAKKGFSYYNIPLSMSIKIKELVQNGSTLNNVFFLGEKWIVIYDKYKYISNL
ncbi:MAG: hypothetical protein GXO80_09240 [Chlorobi bacterium]|nr:hypothetical protein [Chlorobiota bacterium]